MLCRILTELKLLSTSVGIIVLSAGVGKYVSETFSNQAVTVLTSSREHEYADWDIAT